VIFQKIPQHGGGGVGERNCDGISFHAFNGSR
jgi:hypothetical protein